VTIDKIAWLLAKAYPYDRQHPDRADHATRGACRPAQGRGHRGL
jgi:hypothetical protein